MQDPTYIDVDGCEYTYTPPSDLCSLRRYNIAQCSRQRMTDSICRPDDSGDWCEYWKRERISFWSTLARSIPSKFK